MIRLALLSCGALASAASAQGVPTASVAARAETTPVGTLDDAADDPAIWRNAAEPAKSLIIATDKKAGIHVYGLDGKVRSFTRSPRLNNVDLRDGVMRGRRPVVLVAASDRRDIGNARMALFTLDTQKAKLKPLASFAVGPGEAYGMCLWQRAADKALFGFVVMKDGRVDQVALDLAGRKPRGAVVRSIKLRTQSEGCIADDRTGQLYVAEEDAGLWRVAADPSAPATLARIASVDGSILVADVEGLALAPVGAAGGFLIASSQGDNAYAVFELPDARFVGRFRIADGAVDATSETDGIELVAGDFGPAFPAGLFVAQDGNNAPDTQNFKLTAWGDIITALGLEKGK